MKQYSLRTLIGFVIFIAIDSQFVYSQEIRKFGQQGTWELGGSAAYINSTQVTNGNTGSTISAFLLSPYVGVFLTDGFEIGINPLGYSTTSSINSSTTSINTFIAPSYNFKTETALFPFIEAQIGYTSMNDKITLSSPFNTTVETKRGGMSWGGRAGIKGEIVSHGLLNIAIQYQQRNLTPDGATNRSGYNEIFFSLGFTLWL